MKSETTNTIERRRTICAVLFSSAARSVPAPRAATGTGRVVILCSRCSTCLRPPRAGSTVSTAVPYSSAPTRLPWRVSTRASTATNSLDTVRLAVSREPKSIEPLMSSTNHAVRSRSSWNSRTYGCCSRAVTFQSM